MTLEVGPSGRDHTLVTCDGPCDLSIEVVAHNDERAVVMAASEGWRFPEGDRAFCPACSDALDIDKGEA